MTFTKTTEQSSKYEHLEKMSVQELLFNINQEDQTVPLAVAKALPSIEIVVTQIVAKMKLGGRLFYIGAGTSGRLGIVDASECPPTFGVPFDLVNGIIAGGDKAIRRAVENAEDNATQAWIDLQEHNINSNDVVVGIAASGTTPYVIGGLEMCNKNNIITGSISCNAGSPLSQTAQFPIEVIVGPEFVTGSSRMKAGTAQKLVLNMISTATMIQLGKVKGNKMVDMQLSNSKLVDRGVKMIMSEIPVSYEEGSQLLSQLGSVRKAVDFYNSQKIKLMATNKDLLAKALKYLSGALPLLFIGPAVIHNAFMNQKNNWHYLVLAIGIAFCVFGVYCLFFGLKTIMKSLFND